MVRGGRSWDTSPEQLFTAVNSTFFRSCMIDHVSTLILFLMFRRAGCVKRLEAGPNHTKRIRNDWAKRLEEISIPSETRRADCVCRPGTGPRSSETRRAVCTKRLEDGPRPSETRVPTVSADGKLALVTQIVFGNDCVERLEVVSFIPETFVS